MAVKRRFSDSYEDGRGNIYASNTNTRSGPGMTPIVRTASEVHDDMLDNVTRSMMPSGNAQVGIGPGESIYTPTSVPNQGPTSGPGNAVQGASYRGPQTSVGRYSPSLRVTSYQSRLADMEDQDKPAFTSRYEPTIQSILDGILNRKSFDLNSDPNYQSLYDHYAQSYMAQGNRAMRDQLGASAGLTGGYGSTAAQAAASQAYDNYMQGLNDRNMQLMQIAYQMYGDETADRYNRLGAVTGLDNTDYARYRDEVNDFYNDRDYLASRYQTEYGNDYGQFRDTVGDFYNDRNYNRSVLENDREYEASQDNTAYQKYQDAVSMALRYVQQGLAVPSSISKQITDYTGAADISDVIAAMPVSTGGSGRSGRSGGGSTESKKKDSGEIKNPSIILNDDEQDAYELNLMDRLIDAGLPEEEILRRMNKIDKSADKVRASALSRL